MRIDKQQELLLANTLSFIGYEGLLPIKWLKGPWDNGVLNPICSSV